MSDNDNNNSDSKRVNVSIKIGGIKDPSDPQFLNIVRQLLNKLNELEFKTEKVTLNSEQ